jgi:tRNA(fMet)-specific endonuclease VapC
MRRTLLDTDILSEVLKGRDQVVARQAARYLREFGHFTFTSVSVHEIVYGLTSKGAGRQLALANRYFGDSEVVVPILEDYRLSGEIRGNARKLGHQLALDDCLIGSIAYRLGRPVVTGNTGHFTAMQLAGLAIELESWRL